MERIALTTADSAENLERLTDLMLALGICNCVFNASTVDLAEASTQRHKLINVEQARLQRLQSPMW